MKKTTAIPFFCGVFLHLFIGLSCVSAQNDTPNKLIAKGATLIREATDYAFTEGPAVDPEGNVFFTDQPNDRIIKRAVDGTISVYMEKTGRANGLYFDNQGNLLSCSDLENQLWKIAPDQTVTVLVRDFEGKKLNGPNDLWVDPKGGVYFTDPFYKRSYWNRSEKEIEKENVYYLSPDQKTLTLAATDFVRPNGIVGTPDGKKLYVADINAGKTWAFTINSDGTLTDKKLFTELGSDGMTLDNKGNVYLTGKGVSVFNPQGEKIAQIDVDERWTANVCFGGKKQKTLFITASKSLYTLNMKVKGVR
ncbi:MAG: SMP-30/gluconolactonase/LRE family protein [Bacteroidia bacterium]|nr:SMP-30/gluconolactonase/LRE family protein [Bacteroidia bacterium]